LLNFLFVCLSKKSKKNELLAQNAMHNKHLERKKNKINFLPFKWR
jgi:hypothetical protein